MRRAIAWLLFALAATPLCATTPPAAQALSEGIWLIPGNFLPGLQPDGNTVVLRGDKGLVVVDTGRHEWHYRAILDFARAQGRPVSAIVNTHWHLDHASGNEAIRKAHPAARVHASTAIERVIREIWPTTTPQLHAYLAQPGVSAALAADIRGDIHAQTHPEPMRPDAPVTRSGPAVIDGLALEVRLAPNAATDGDVWLFDPRSRTAVVGDLVTLPVPFLDTACVAGWRAALQQVDETPFTTLVPGHGAPMDRARFGQWRSAFERFAGCAASDAPAPACAARWVEDSTALRDPGPGDDRRAGAMAESYVTMLRKNGGNSSFCRAS